MSTCPCCGEEFEQSHDPNEEFCSTCILNVHADILAGCVSKSPNSIIWGDDCPDCDNPMIAKETADGDDYHYCPHCKQLY